MPENGNDRPPGPRPVWSGVLTFGLVSVPVRMYSGARGSGGTGLRMVGPDGRPLQARWTNRESGKEIPSAEIVRGYEVGDGRWITVTEEELDSLAPEKSREIDLRRFVPLDALDPVWFDRPYVLTPDGGITKPYRLLAEAMDRTGRAGVATFVMRGKEYLVAILSEEGVLRAETLRFHDELRTPADVGLEPPGDAGAGTIGKLVDAMGDLSADTIDPKELADRRTAALERLIERKLKKGEDVVDSPEAAAEAADGGDPKVIDLLAVLRRSLETGGEDAGEAGAGAERAGPRRAGRKSGRDRAPAADPDGPPLEERTKAELYEQAQELDIPGRSSMTKPELLEALKQARAG